MQTGEFIRALRRRWYLVLATSLFAIAATTLVVVRVGPTYEATGSALVLPPMTTVERDSQVQVVGNPLLSLGGVSQARDLVIQQLVSQSVQEEIALAYPGTEYQVTQDFTNSAPVILVTMEADSASTASIALEAVIAKIPSILDKLQAAFDLPADASIMSTPLVQDTQPQALHKDQIRTGIVVAMAVLAAGLLLIGLLDGLLARRRRDLARDSDLKSLRMPGIVAPDPQVQGPQESARRLGPRAPVVPSTRQLNQRGPNSESTHSPRRVRSVPSADSDQYPSDSQSAG